MDIAKKDYEEGNSQIVLYQPNETISIEVKLDVDYDTVWLTQAQMVELFASSKANISEHISNIFQQCELQPESTVRKFRIVRKEGARTVTRTIDHYNLDVIISVGFRVNSRQGKDTPITIITIITVKNGHPISVIEGSILYIFKYKYIENRFS